MQLLLIDTSGVEGTAALADTSTMPAIRATELLPGRTSSERLVPAVRALLETQGWKLRQLEAIVVVHGPGSFTGVRIGLSAAKGFSEASGVPIVAVSRLAVLAAVAYEERAAAAGAKARVAMDAGRGEFYYGEYCDRECVLEALLTRVELEAAVGSETLTLCESRLADLAEALTVKMVREPVATDALDLAISRVEAKLFDDAATIDANYLRRTDVQLFARPGAR